MFKHSTFQTGAQFIHSNTNQAFTRSNIQHKYTFTLSTRDATFKLWGFQSHTHTHISLKQFQAVNCSHFQTCKLWLYPILLHSFPHPHPWPIPPWWTKHIWHFFTDVTEIRFPQKVLDCNSWKHVWGGFHGKLPRGFPHRGVRVLRCPQWTNSLFCLFIHTKHTVWKQSSNPRGWLTESNRPLAHGGTGLVLLFLGQIICLLRCVDLYVNHGGLQADLNGGV